MAEGTTDKRGRGRPSVLDPVVEDAIRGLGNMESSSRRTVVNWLYVSRAAARLGVDGTPESPYAYLYNGGKLRKTILAELERVADDEAMHALARRICDDRLPTDQAVALIRRVRFGNDQAPPDRLGDALLAAINAHLARYPETTRAEIVAVLEQTAFIVEDGED